MKHEGDQTTPPAPLLNKVAVFERIVSDVFSHLLRG